MSNTLTNYLPKWLATALPILRKNCVMPRLVNNDFSMQPMAKGSQVDIPIPPTLSVSDVTPGVTPAASSDISPTTVALSLSSWKYVKFGLTDKELTQINSGESFVPKALDASMKALAEKVNSDIFSAYTKVYGYVGTAGTTPFASTVAAATDARKVLTNQLAPTTDRYLVLDPSAEANALNLSAFAAVQNSGDGNVVKEGLLGRKYGFDTYCDQQVPTHTTGAAAGYLVNNGAGYAAGISTLAIDTGTGAWVDGDIITFAGHSQTYVVDGTSTTTSLVLKNALVAAVADNEVITKKASHVVNLAFNKDAFAFAARPLSGVIDGFGSLIASFVMQDPSGIPVRIQVIREWMQTSIVLDILYGFQCIRPELACRIAG